MLKVIIWGIGGRMGRTLLETISNKENVTCVGGFDKFADPAAFSVPVFNDVDSIDVKADVIIDIRTASFCKSQQIRRRSLFNRSFG